MFVPLLTCETCGFATSSLAVWNAGHVCVDPSKPVIDVKEIGAEKAGGSQRVRAVLDAGTCTACRMADGTIADATPACEHVASGAAICRCVLVKTRG